MPYKKQVDTVILYLPVFMERKTGLEPATLSLGS